VSNSEKIQSADGRTIAIIVRAGFEKDGTNFLSKEEYPLQLGISRYRKGDKIRPHRHIHKRTVIDKIQEIVHFESGRAIVNLYDLSGTKFKSIEFSIGDTIFFVDGGHGFTMLEDTKLMEVKQGPYFGKDKDKMMIE
jgi:hypothetical protein